VATLVVEALQLGAGNRATNLVREDATVAQAVGVNVGALRRRTLIFSGALGGLAGGLYPLVFGVVNPNAGGFSLVVTGLTVVVLGGMRSWVGVTIGAILVTWLPEWLSFMEKWRDVVYGALIVVMVIFAPQGITDIVRRVVTWVTRQWRTRRGPASPPSVVSGPPPTNPSAGDSDDELDIPTAEEVGQ